MTLIFRIKTNPCLGRRGRNKKTKKKKKLLTPVAAHCSDAVDVAITAAESVLRFHVVALSKSHQPFIDIKFFKSAIQKAIKRKAKRKIKDHIDDNVAHMALTHITRLAGDAAFGAATEWNARSDPT